MKNFQGELNTNALDATLTALFNVEGRDNVKRVYEIVNGVMNMAFSEGQHTTNEGVEAMRKADAEKFGENSINSYWMGFAAGIAKERDDNADQMREKNKNTEPPLFKVTSLSGDDDAGFVQSALALDDTLVLQRDSGDETEVSMSQRLR